MPHICKLYLCTHGDSRDNNNITSVEVMRKAVWPALEILDIMDNNFRDAKSLALGCFPRMQQLQMYSRFGEDKNSFTEQRFPAKIQAASLFQLSMKRAHFYCGRCIVRILREKWLYVRIT